MNVCAFPDERCPICGAKAVDMTTMEDERRHFLCLGMPGHEWAVGTAPPEDAEPPAVPAPEKNPLVRFVSSLFKR